MNMRSQQINLPTLQILMDKGIEKFKNIEKSECYLIIGNAGLSSNKNTDVKNVKYMIDEQANIYSKQYFIYPEFHKTKENILLCECPYFYYKGTKEMQICQAISLELVLNIVKKISGIMIVIDFNELYSSRGMSYQNLIERLAHLFHSQFDVIFKSSIFVIVNKPKADSIEDIKNGILLDYQENVDNLQRELASIDENDNKNDLFIKEKRKLDFTKLFISHKNQMFILDTSDNGESRSAIISELMQATPLDSIQFNFETFYDDVLKGFNFNLRKFIDETIIKIKTPIVQENNKHIINM